MEYTWRWFGKNDKITLPMLRQIGVEGIVTALHDVPLGEVWTREKIHDLRLFIEQHGLRWSVVESLPVTETIKYGGPDRDEQISRYKESLRNLAAEGIRTVCYNFMPVLDWARTDLLHPNADGTSNLFFSYAEFAYFDIYILQRPGAREEWSRFRIPGMDIERDIVAEADAIYSRCEGAEVRGYENTDKSRCEVRGTWYENTDGTSEHISHLVPRTSYLEKPSYLNDYNHRLVENIIVKTQGFVSGNIREDDEHPLELFRQLLALYQGVTKEQLRANMRYFLEQVMPVCDECDIDLCVHPDDPPFPVLGLPRIVNSADDIDWLLSAVDNPHNGLTFCAGSLSAGAHNDVVAMARRYAPRTHFVHLRSCQILPNGDFTEAPHLGGRADVVELARIFLDEERRRATFNTHHPSPITQIPMRVDHGKTMLGDEARGYNAGYSFLGRMYALAQMQGVVATLKKSDNKE